MIRSRHLPCLATVLVLVAFAVAACAEGPAPPAPLDTRHDACGFCRMTVSSQRFASQLVAPGEEPRFFDDLGCLRAYLTGGGTLPSGAIAYVADHRTGDWVVAARAVYTRVPALDTPMGSHLVAHADAASRDADADAAGGEPVPVAELFGPGGAPEGRP